MADSERQVIGTYSYDDGKYTMHRIDGYREKWHSWGRLHFLCAAKSTS